MKYISIALLALVLGLGTGCSDDSFKTKIDTLVLSTGKLYFNAGYICAICEEMQRHPENFKAGAVKEKAEVCKQFKDFDTFHKLSTEGTIHE